MIKLILLFITTGAALVVVVALIVGIAWLAVAVPVDDTARAGRTTERPPCVEGIV
jgi:hypothetical protein